MREVNRDLDLREAVNTLTRMTAHRIVVEAPDGGEIGKFVHQAPLIGQLRVALRPSMEAKNGGGSGGGDGGSAAPMSLDAHDLLEEIEEEATRQWWIFKSLTRETKKPAPGTSQPRTRPLPVELRVQFWAARAHLIDGGVEEAWETMRRWIRSIESLFDPVHRMELRGSCPACEVAYIHVEKDGEQVRTPALTAGWSAGAGSVASCAACGKRWAGFDLHELAEHVNPVVGEMVVNPG